MSSSRLQPRKQPRQDRAEATRRRILEAAAHVFRRLRLCGGYHKSHRRAGRDFDRVAVPVLPQQGRDPRRAHDRPHSPGFALIHQHLATGLPDTIEDTVRVFVGSAIANHRDSPRLHRVLFEEAPRPPEFLAMLHRSEDAVIAAAEAVLAAHPEVRVTETDTAARMVVATIESLVHRLIAGPRPIDPQLFEDQLVDMLTRYLTG